MAEIIKQLTGLVGVLIPVWIIWVIMHYRSKNKVRTGLNEEDITQLEELNRIAEQMAERIKTLESILDAEAPEWRDHDSEK